MKSNDVLIKLDIMIPNPKCELNYNKDYELLIATVLSAQSTDARVNMVTKVLFKKYNIKSLATANQKDIETIIHSVGTYQRKSEYIIGIAKRLNVETNGLVPNNREFLESLPGVGRKTCNVVLSELYNEPAIAVDTHVFRVSKRLGISTNKANVYQTEKSLMKYFPKEKWSRVHLQLVLFGRNICKSIHPLCNKCEFKDTCKYKKL